MKAFYNLIVSISGFCVLLVPVISVISAIFPRAKKGVQRFFRNLLGIEELKQDIKQLNEKTEKVTKDLEDHIKAGKQRLETDKNLLRSSLIRSFSYYIDRGFITFEELEVLQTEYDQYKTLGGNGVIQNKWEQQILKLPNQPS